MSESVLEQTARGGFPWPPREDRSTLDELLLTWRRSMLEPSQFFRAMPVRGGLAAPVVYALLMGVPAAGIALFWRAALLFVAGADSPLAPAGEPGDGLWLIVGFLLSPLLVIVTLLVGGAVTHVCLLLLGAAHSGIEATLRVISFSYSPQLLAVIPLLGPLIGSVWSLVLVIVGLREAHDTSGWRAAIAVFLPIFIVLFLGLLAIALVAVLAVAAGSLPR